MRKVETGEIAEVFFGGGIVGAGGVEFGFEFAEVDCAAIDANRGAPGFSFFVKRNALVF